MPAGLSDSEALSASYNCQRCYRHRATPCRDVPRYGPSADGWARDSATEMPTSALGAMLRVGSYGGWLAMAENNRVLAGAGAHIQSHIPNIERTIADASTAVSLVVSVYTESDVCGIGIARAHMNTLLKWGDSPRLRSRATLCLR